MDGTKNENAQIQGDSSGGAGMPHPYRKLVWELGLAHSLGNDDVRWQADVGLQ